jgi:hypothetical protein
MNISVLLDGVDVTPRTMLSATRIGSDSSRRVTTATVNVLWTGPNEGAVYDQAVYDTDCYAFTISDLAKVTILDARDGVTKLFEGNVSSLSLKQSDLANPNQLYYECSCNDYAIWLDRAVCNKEFTVLFPCSDAVLIQSLIGQFCTRIHAGANVVPLIPALTGYDYDGKTCRQVLDDLIGLSAGDWHVDFNGELFYGAIASAPLAPFDLSTSPDGVSSFPVRVDGWTRDFTNPINHCIVRGGLLPSGVYMEATAQDLQSMAAYGDMQVLIIDDQLTDAGLAALRAQSTVLQYAYPAEQGNFTIWKDGLKLGQKVNLTEETLAVDGQYVIRSLTWQWLDAERVQYTATCGASRPDLESFLRLLDQRTRWQTSQITPATPINGSVSDASITAGGISADSINSVNANSIVGTIDAGQIGTINASQIVGQITASQIGSVNAGSIQGSITASQIGSVSATTIQGAIVASQISTVNATSIQGAIVASQIGSVNAPAIQGAIVAGQIGSVNATTIQGVIISSQVADGIIDSLSKFATALSPVPVVASAPTLPDKNFPPFSYFYSNSTGHFYQVNTAGTAYTDAGTDPTQLTGTMQFYNIGHMSAQSIIGLILAAQIQSIRADQITGQIQAAQIGTISASQITGQITATQIASVSATTITGQLTAAQIGAVNASAIVGQVAAAQIGAVNASVIQGQIVASQIGTINAATITIGQIVDGQIANINGSKLTVGTVTSDKLSATSIDVGYGGNKPGVINVYDGTSTVVSRVGLLSSGNYGGWFKVFGAGGTGYSDAPLYTDTSGNLYINNATLDVENTATSTRLRTGPTTFDSTYGSIALIAEKTDGTDKAQLITRGIVIYYQGTKVGALVRDPTDANSGSLELDGASGAATCLLTGSNGLIQGKAFGITGAGLTGQSVTVTQQDGSKMTFTGGIVTSTSGPTFSPITGNINVARWIAGNVVSGYYQLYFANGLITSATFYAS